MTIRVTFRENHYVTSGEVSEDVTEYSYEDNENANAYRVVGQSLELQLGIFQEEKFRLIQTYAPGTWFSVEKILDGVE